MCNYYEEDQKWEDFHDRMRMIRAYVDNEFQRDYTRIAVVRPTNVAPVVLQGQAQREVRMGRFGLVPVWAKDPRVMKSTMNARSETVLEKPMWKRPFIKQRALVPATAFFEWKAIEGSKQKQRMRITYKGGEPFCFAGLWDRWTSHAPNADGEPLALYSFAIITTTPNALMGEIHDRQPVILAPDEYDVWMAQDTPVDTLRGLMQACPGAWLEMKEAA